MNPHDPSKTRSNSRAFIWAIFASSLLLGCQSESTSLDDPISVYRDRMLVQHEQQGTAEAEKSADQQPIAHPVPEQSDLPARASLMTQPATTEQPAPADILAEMPDPTDAPRVFAERLEALRVEQANRQDQRVVRNYERVVAQASEYLQKITRPKQVRIGLAECVQRGLENSYVIRSEAHNPAISQTQIVEAEAAFDAEFYLDTAWADQDQASLSAFVAGSSDSRTYEGGFRKLLPTGTQTSIALKQARSQNSLPAEFQTLNPGYSTSMIASLRQPLLRGFGLDVNRATINVRKAEFQVTYETFVQRVRDTLLEIESRYWQLVQARRTSSILAISVAQNYVTYKNMVERLDHDATQVEVANSESNWKERYVNYLEAVKLVRDAEDALKNALNDPELKLSDDIEIIPSETPLAAPMVMDHFAEVRTALDRRSEIRQARQRIEAARIGTVAAKNAILPQFDVTFQYEVQGLGRSADSSFDNLTTNRFISYTLGASFAYNFGERRARAAHRRSRLQESQAVVGLNQATDAIVEEVNNAIRTLMVRFEQLPPQYESVRSASRNLRALQARTQRIDPNYLQTELGAVEQLANTRTTLLRVLTEYNVGIVQLERAKGTLLDYNNVVVSDVKPGR